MKEKGASFGPSGSAIQSAGVPSVYTKGRHEIIFLATFGKKSFCLFFFFFFFYTLVFTLRLSIINERPPPPFSLPSSSHPSKQSKQKHTHKDKQVEQDRHQFEEREEAHFNL